MVSIFGFPEWFSNFHPFEKLPALCLSDLSYVLSILDWPLTAVQSTYSVADNIVINRNNGIISSTLLRISDTTNIWKHFVFCRE